jgi:hypothetical protein
VFNPRSQTGGLTRAFFPKATVQIPLPWHYRGYAVRPSAHRLSDGFFSSNLTLSRSIEREAQTAYYDFYSLGYFATENEALGYSGLWAREWIDARG